MDDGVNTYKTLTKDQRLVAGAGATEIEIATQLAAFAKSREGELFFLSWFVFFSLLLLLLL